MGGVVCGGGWGSYRDGLGGGMVKVLKGREWGEVLFEVWFLGWGLDIGFVCWGEGDFCGFGEFGGLGWVCSWVGFVVFFGFVFLGIGVGCVSVVLVVCLGGVVVMGVLVDGGGFGVFSVVLLFGFYMVVDYLGMGLGGMVFLRGLGEGGGCCVVCFCWCLSFGGLDDVGLGVFVLGCGLW
uniref:NADH dehydrogenase subunit 6 n=1 Tax=Knipowitschia caucasica TaxID=637954 RepID=A0AAV2KVY9_KNICA